jgi:hypothetical protein
MSCNFKNMLYETIKYQAELILGQKKTRDITIMDGSASGSASSSISSSASSSGSSSTSDPCAVGDGTPVNASEACNTLAQIEGNGKYTQQNAPRFSAAAGRYQFVGDTAVNVLKGMGKARTTAEARSLWSRCRTSNTEECKKLQDEMCNYYQKQQESQLKAAGIPFTTRNMYLAWNMGVGGAKTILRAANNGCSNVTHSKIASNMRNQAWVHTNNSCKFLKGMEGYIKRQGVNP